MKAIIKGDKIVCERDFHHQLAKQLDFGPYYGNNLDALWDRLSTDVDRPVEIIWLHSETSKVALGSTFNNIIELFEQVVQQDMEFMRAKTFEYKLIK